jgi:hypothetical protein
LTGALSGAVDDRAGRAADPALPGGASAISESVLRLFKGLRRLLRAAVTSRPAPGAWSDARRRRTVRRQRASGCALSGAVDDRAGRVADLALQSGASAMSEPVLSLFKGLRRLLRAADSAEGVAPLGGAAVTAKENGRNSLKWLRCLPISRRFA